MRPSAPVTPRLDGDAERVRLEHEQKLREIQRAPAIGLAVVGDFELEDGVSLPIPHKLGRRPLTYMTTPPKNAVSAGYIVEVARDERYVTLQANGYGATITVTLTVL